MKKKTYGKISLFDWKENLSKDWYVYFSFRNPATGKLERQNNIYGNINTYDTVKKRKKAAAIIIEGLEKLLESGWSPYKEKALQPSNELQTVYQCIPHAIKIAEKLYALSTYQDFRGRMNLFKEWLLDQNLHDTPIKNVDAKMISEYLNVVLLRTSPRNRNNTKLNLSSFFKILKRESIVDINVVDTIDTLKAIPTKNKTFSRDQEDQLLELFNERDKLLGLFIAFVSINLLRPAEVCRLKIGDIDLKDKVLKVKTKNAPLKTKIIPDLLIKMLPDLTTYSSGEYLFTPKGPGQWDANEVNRRNFFGKRFLKIKKILGLGKEYGMYSFRSTYITKLYRELRKVYSPFETKSRLMHITGHGTMEALEAYLRDIDAELPDDYSHLLINSELHKKN